RSAEQLREVIRKGIPEGGMPAFNLPAPQLDALAGFVRSLNSQAADNPVRGDPAAGDRFFFGDGRCASCHMVRGEGRPSGPDLSNVGRELSVEEIREALLSPSARITPGYDFVTVRLRDGKTLQGFARNRDDYDLQLQDLNGQFHLLRTGQIAAIQDEKQSKMPPVTASQETLQNLVAYLSGLTGVKPGPLTAPAETAGIDFSRILNPKPGDWLTYNGKLSGNRYSELSEIDNANVSQLSLKWIFSIPHFGLESTPLVADGVMYVTGPNQAFAVDARGGRQIWQYSRPRSSGLVGDASLGTNRGMAILGDKVFMMMDNAHLVALNRSTGRVVWEAAMPDELQHYGSTVAPLIVNDLVISGVSGGDWGIRGFIAAYKASTGERVWRHWTVPAKGEPGYDTWKEKDPAFGGGSTWLTGSYDRETDTLFWPTGNPWPDSDDRQRTGDNLYTDCVLALNPADGKLKWHYQFTPHDVHDWDATEPMVLVDAKFRGEDRKLLLHADRNGFFYVFDRTDGKLLLASKFLNRLTWARGIGPDGRPETLPAYIPPPGGATVCPQGEATNWNSTAYSPLTHLYYFMALEKCGFVAPPGSYRKKHPDEEPAKKYLRALDIDTGKIVWETPQTGSTESKRWAGVLGTAGGILFYADPGGNFVAADARDGKLLWHFATSAIVKAGPMTYTVDGKQFVAIAAGSNILSFGLASR
ncbi:MAG: PQQ-binding-like beta-propeller repeat protein, partial [Acidobacteriota bacterium]|nr:PQQ-binding-like beta-propeller repeat protein [Acidobacteriota bacterium]